MLYFIFDFLENIIHPFHKLAASSHVHNIFRLFLCLTKFSFHPKRNEAWLLKASVVCTSYLTNFRTTQSLNLLGSHDISGKFQYFLELLPSPQFSQNENFVSTSKNLQRNRNWSLPGVRCFTWKLEFVSNILRIIVGRLTEKLPNNSTNNFMLTRILNRFNLTPIPIYGKAITSTQRFIYDRDNFSLIKNQQPSFYFRRFL